METKNRSIVTATAVAGLMTVATLPGALAETEDSVFRVAVHADLANLDPIATGGYITRNHGLMVFDTLFALDADMQPQPQMVDSWEVSDDELTYSFTLREGLLWHDGEPVRAQDAVASIDRWFHRDGMGQMLREFTEDLSAVDDDTFELVLTEPYALVLESMAKIGTHPLFIMPERLAETDPGEQVSEMVGSGPFVFEEDLWEPGHRIVYSRFEDYVPRDEEPSFIAGGKVVNFDRVEWRYIPDISSAVNAIQTGEIDMIEEVPPDLISILESAPEVELIERNPFGEQGWLRFNHQVPPFDDVLVRKAALWALDQETYMQAIVGNPDYYNVCAAMFVCGTPLASEAGAEPIMTRDMDRARELLEESSYDGETVLIMQPADIPLYSGMTLVTSRALDDLGMNVELASMDWGSILSRRMVTDPVEEGGWSILQTAWNGADLTNPIANLGVHASGLDLAWPGWPDDEEIESLREEFVRTADPDGQREIAEKIQERAYDLVTYAPIGEFQQPSAIRDDISGVVRSPAAVFWGISRN